ncbi:Outer-membrane lipoprotein LolB [Methylophilaceae bacterium]|nr:Outer-membrane lipoprotein LolB [Methylophilaceae bacterium]
MLAGCSLMQPRPVADQPLPAPAGTPAELHQIHLGQLKNIRTFYLHGRIGIQTEGKGTSGATRWRHRPEVDDISMLSPVGGTLAKIISGADGVTLTTNDGKMFQASDAQSLTQQHLGWSLPLQGLPDWALGRPTAKLTEYMEWDAWGRIVKLQQDGWEIEYPEYMQAGGYNLPRKVNLRSSKLTLKLIIERWDELGTATASDTKTRHANQAE